MDGIPGWEHFAALSKNCENGYLFLYLIPVICSMVEPGSTSMMYQHQSLAFEARGACTSAATNSTPNSPPYQGEPDLRRLCDLKKSVIANLPTHCSHCNAPLTPNMCLELRGGEIMAYCKTKGACGKSLVLFAGVDLTYPIYEKFCPFRAVEAGSAPQTSATPQLISPDAVHVDPQQPNVAEQHMFPDFSGFPETTPQSSDTIRMQVRPGVFRNVDVYALHGITRPDKVCALCNQTYSAHQDRCDQHGWKEVRREHYALPEDWPVYDSSQGTWLTRAELAATFA